jgi:hypothetical protein
MMKKAVLVLTMLSLVKVAFSATPQELLKGYEAQSGKASSVHGEQFQQRNCQSKKTSK